MVRCEELLNCEWTPSIEFGLNVLTYMEVIALVIAIFVLYKFYKEKSLTDLKINKILYILEK